MLSKAKKQPDFVPLTAETTESWLPAEKIIEEVRRIAGLEDRRVTSENGQLSHRGFFLKRYMFTPKNHPSGDIHGFRLVIVWDIMPD